MANDQITRKRKWWIAGLLGFLVPGLGQVYNSQATKGLFYYFVLSTWGGLVFSMVYTVMKYPGTRGPCDQQPTVLPVQQSRPGRSGHFQGAG